MLVAGLYTARNPTHAEAAPPHQATGPPAIRLRLDAVDRAGQVAGVEATLVGPEREHGSRVALDDGARSGLVLAARGERDHLGPVVADAAEQRHVELRADVVDAHRGRVLGEQAERVREAAAVAAGQPRAARETVVRALLRVDDLVRRGRLRQAVLRQIGHERLLVLADERELPRLADAARDGLQLELALLVPREADHRLGER